MAWRSFGMPRLAEYRWLRVLWAASAELLDRDLRRGDVGVAEAEVDDVLACSPGLHLQPSMMAKT